MHIDQTNIWRSSIFAPLKRQQRRSPTFPSSANKTGEAKGDGVVVVAL